MRSTLTDSEETSISNQSKPSIESKTSDDSGSDSGSEIAVSMRSKKHHKDNASNAGRVKTTNRSKSQPTSSGKDQPVRVSSRQARVENTLMSNLLTKVYKHEAAIYFMRPVDPEELEIPDYFDIIDKPMDLGTVRQKLTDLRYEKTLMGEPFEAFAADVRLTLVNAYTYNHMEDNPVHIAAKELEAFFEQHYKTLVNTITRQRQEEDEAAMAAAGGKTTKSNSPSSTKARKSRKGRFAEAESDDEFAIENFTYSEQELKAMKSGKSKKKGSKQAKKMVVNGSEEVDSEMEEAEASFSADSGDEESDSDGDADTDGFEFRIQHVLASKTMTPKEWRSICDHMNTKEITRGSAWKQPDEEYNDDSEYVVTKYLIKWAHASYLHVSWETEKDLLDCVGATAKAQLKKFHIRIALGQELFEDLGRGEFFLPSFTTIERILDVDDPRVDMRKVDWQSAPLPEFDPCAIEDYTDSEDEQANAVDDAMEVIQEPVHTDHVDYSAMPLSAGQADIEEGEQYITGGDEEFAIPMPPVQPVNDDLLDLDFSNDGHDTVKLPSSNDVAAAAAAAAAAALMGASPKPREVIDADIRMEGSETLVDLDVLVSPKKFDKSEFNALVGGSTTEITSPANLAAIAGDSDDDMLFDSDEERAISARGTQQQQPPQSEPGMTQGTTQYKPDPADEEEDEIPEDEADEGLEREMRIAAESPSGTEVVGRRHSSRSRRDTKRLIEEDAHVEIKSNRPRRNKRTTESSSKTTKPEKVLDAKSLKAKKQKAFKAMLAREPPCEYLHGFGKGKIMVTVKWEGLPYSDTSFEDLRDLQRMYIDYEAPMRAFFRREQSTPTKGTTKVRRALDVAAMEASNGPELSNKDLELRDYQWEGVRWLLFNWSQRRNSILADEMGLGKTIQTAVFLSMLSKQQGMRGPFLIVAPLSTIVQWQREIQIWTDMDVIIYHGNAEDREILRNYEFHYMTRKPNEGTKLQVVITTPDTCMSFDTKGSARRELTKIKWDMLVVDEAHRLKSYDSKVGSSLRFDFDYLNCLLLTGTPLQNNTDELWTLLNFINREDFDDREVFCEQFGDLKEASQLKDLHARLKPYLLRREKEHVEKKVPPKEEVIVEVELTVAQKQYYRAIYEQKTGFLHKNGAKDGPSLSNLAMELRKCCNHPFLIKGAESELCKQMADKTALEQVVNSSGKMMLLDKLLPKLRADGHRVLIFSQFRILLNIIEDYMIMKGYGFERVDGAITGRKRQNAIDRYTKDGVFCMLLSTRAGGVGINLTAADTVIIFDSDWNPQNDIQAQARAHRIGQTKKVKVYRFITRKTYETAMFQTASVKLGLDYAVMGGVKAPTLAGITDKNAENFSNLSKKELENLLKHGAYDIFTEDKDGSGVQASEKFAEEDIENILAHSSTVIHGSNKTDDNAGASASFSKASFVTSSGADDLAIDDPEFWSKVVGGDDDSAEQVEHSNRGRRCKDFVDSYKEPGMTFTAFESDSDGDSEMDADSHSKKSDFDVKAEFTERNMSRLLQSLCSQGYGNWEAIRSATKLRWSHKDIAKASRAIILLLVCWASLDQDRSTFEAQWRAAQCPQSIKKSKWGFEDLQYVEDFFKRNRASRLALAASRESASAQKSKVCKSVEELYNACSAMPMAVYFRKAVDPIALDIPDYFDIIKRPMDLGLIKQNMQREHYLGDHAKFAEHMRLCFENAYVYNHMEDNPVHIAGKTMEKDFNEKYQEYLDYLAEVPVEDSLLNKAFLQTYGLSDSEEEFFDYFDNAGMQFSIQSLLYEYADVTPTVLSKDDLMGLDEEATSELEKSNSEENDAKKDLKFQHLREVVLSARTSPDVEDFDLWEQGKTAAIRTQARNKLRNIEDMFEIRSLASVACRSRWAAPLETVTPQAAAETKDEAAMDVEVGSEASTAAPVADNTSDVASVQATAQPLIAKKLSDCPHLEPSDTPGWDYSFDAWLVITVDAIGYPEGKRKQQLLQSRWVEFLSSKGLTEGGPESATDVAQDEAKDISSATSTGNFPRDMMLGKFPIKRCKEIGIALRGGSEQAIAAAAKEAAREAAQQARAAAAAEKAAAKAAKAAAALPKQIFSAMQRVGRPRTGYDELLVKLSASKPEKGPEVVSGDEGTPLAEMPGSEQRHTFVLTWTMLAKEVGMTADSEGKYDLEKLKTIVTSIVDTAYEPTDPTTAAKEIAAEGHILDGSGLTPKALLSSMDKIDVIHQLRLVCACLDTEGIRTGIASACKQAGPHVGPARRDITLPVWWTTEHDINLMRLCFTQGLGYGQWKKMAAHKIIADAPAEFVMPAKIAGFDWVTALSPKICEKRLQALANGLSRYMASLPENAVGYVPSGPRSPVRAKTSQGKGKKGSLASGSGNILPLVTKMENYKRASWIDAFSSVSKPKAQSSASTSFSGAALLRNMDKEAGAKSEKALVHDLSGGDEAATEENAVNIPVAKSPTKLSDRGKKGSPVKKAASPVKKKIPPSWMGNSELQGEPVAVTEEKKRHASNAVSDSNQPSHTPQTPAGNEIIVLDEASPCKAAREDDHLAKLVSTAVTPTQQPADETNQVDSAPKTETATGKRKADSDEANKKTKRAKKVKDPNAPKKAQTAYDYFCADRRPKLKEQSPDLKPTEVMKSLGADWKEATDEEKAPFLELAIADSARYNAEMVEYRKQHPGEPKTDSNSEAVKPVSKKPTKKEKEVPKPSGPGIMSFFGAPKPAAVAQ